MKADDTCEYTWEVADQQGTCRQLAVFSIRSVQTSSRDEGSMLVCGRHLYRSVLALPDQHTVVSKVRREGG